MLEQECFSFEITSSKLFAKTLGLANLQKNKRKIIKIIDKYIYIVVQLCQPKGVFILIKCWEDLKIVEYFKGVKKEVSRIKWTSKKDLLKYATSTIVFMIFFGVFFYLIDLLVAVLRSSL